MPDQQAAPRAAEEIIGKDGRRFPWPREWVITAIATAIEQARAEGRERIMRLHRDGLKRGALDHTCCLACLIALRRVPTGGDDE